MRQIFSSPRLENVERVADLLREAGIEVRLTGGRSYKGNRRGAFRYTEPEAAKPAVWVVKSDDQVRAREILRGAGLLDSTRPTDSYTGPTFRFEPQTQAADPARKRAFRIKVALLAGIAIALGLALSQAPRFTAGPVLATGPFDGSARPVLAPVARAVFAHELDGLNLPVLCYAIDGRDAPAALIGEVARKPFTSVPASHCRRVADSDSGSVYPKTGEAAALLDVSGFRPSAADTATVEFSAYHHRTYGVYKTLEVKHVDGTWRVTRTLKHVAMQGG